MAYQIARMVSTGWERLKRRAGMLLVCGIVCGIVYAVQASLAHADHLRKVGRQVEICAARTSLNFKQFDHNITTMRQAVRNLDETTLYIDQVCASLHIHEDGSVRLEDDTLIGYLKLCENALWAERQLIELNAEYASVNAEARAQARQPLAAQGALQDSKERLFDLAILQRRKLRDSLRELEIGVQRVTELLPAAPLVEGSAIAHMQKELEDFSLPEN